MSPSIEVVSAEVRSSVQESRYKSSTSWAGRSLGIATHQARKRFGLGRPALLPQEIPLAFFSLLATFPVEHPIHNRQVEGSNPSGPTIFIEIIDL
jgi:hypothetical protein